MKDKYIIWWENIITKIQKYYKSQFVHCDFGTEVMQFIVPLKKSEWTFKMLNSVFCNFDGDLHHELMHPYLTAGRTVKSVKNCYDTESYRFQIGCRRYLNNNTLITILVKDKNRARQEMNSD